MRTENGFKSSERRKKEEEEAEIDNFACSIRYSMFHANIYSMSIVDTCLISSVDSQLVNFRWGEKVKNLLEM